MVNTYAIKLFLRNFVKMYAAFSGNTRPWYNIIEAIAIIFGHVYGSIRFKTLYI